MHAGEAQPLSEVERGFDERALPGCSGSRDTIFEIAALAYVWTHYGKL